MIHQAEILTPISENLYGETSFSDSINLDFIRIDICKIYQKNSVDTENAPSGVLIFDCQNSSPVGFEFKVGQKIIFNGDTFSVASVSPFYDSKKLHHYEIGLI